MLLFVFAFAFFLSTSCEEEVVVPEETEEEEPVDTTAGEVPWPSWIFKRWVWEDESTQQSALQMVDDYLARDIPVGALIIDSPWETGYNTFEFDNDLFPDPTSMIDQLHQLDVKVLMWITGTINLDADSLYQHAAERNYFMQENAGSGPAIISWWKGDGSLLDLFNPDAVDWWKGMMDGILDMGIDGWKCDGTDYFALFTPWSPGANRRIDRLEYSYAYYRLFHEYTRERLGNDRVNINRPIDNYGALDVGGDLVAFAPTDINWAGWVGDQDATFTGLKKALNNMFWSARRGYLAFGSDIGGYREDDRYPEGRSRELFIRWAQLGAFSPIMENGGGGEHRPWMFDTETEEVYRLFTKIHDVLRPYLESTARSSWEEPTSMMHFFNKWNYSYLLGNELFVAPILNQEGTVDVQFPSESNWVYLFDLSQTYEGGSSSSFELELSEFPVFVKEGSDLLTYQPLLELL